MAAVDTRGSSISIARSIFQWALIWRVLVLLEIGITTASCVAFASLYLQRDTIFEVESYPSPGYYKANELPDASFVDVAVELLSLLQTYNSFNAERQLKQAVGFFSEEGLDWLRRDVQERLPQIREKARTQSFTFKPDYAETKRPKEDRVEVVLSGFLKIWLGETGPTKEKCTFKVTMTTLPTQEGNSYGIAVIGVERLDIPQKSSAEEI